MCATNRGENVVGKKDAGIGFASVVTLVLRRRVGTTAIAVALIGSMTVASAASRRATAILPSGAEFRIELAISDEERRLGYMYREHVGPREGMLFLFDRSGRHDFWMKNCKVSLDIIWMDANFRIVQIARDQQPCPEDGPCPQLTPLQPSSYVLELAGGMALEEGLQAGERVVVVFDSGAP
jgi:uncharacterized membrane protein (UPF0127 family)